MDKLTLDKLPEVILAKILTFVGDAKDFRCCQQTCRILNRVLKDDLLWGHCEECKPKYRPANQPRWPESNRERALVVRALNQCHSWQRQTNSTILSVLKVRDWKMLVEASKAICFDADLGQCRHKFPLRGDTSAVLMDLVEQCLVTQLQRAKKLALHSCRSGSNTHYYPSVSAADFEMQAEMQCFREGDNVGSLLPPKEQIPVLYDGLFRRQEIQGHVSKKQRDQIVRRLAYRAGVTKMHNDLYPPVWAALVHLIAKLLGPASAALAARVVVQGLDPSILDKQVLRPSESIRDISPLPEHCTHALLQYRRCTHCEQTEVVHWIVPKQVERAARFLGIASRVYGDEWHVDELDDAFGDPKSALNYYKRMDQLAKEVAIAECKYLLVDDQGHPIIANDTKPQAKTSVNICGQQGTADEREMSYLSERTGAMQIGESAALPLGNEPVFQEVNVANQEYLLDEEPDDESYIDSEEEDLDLTDFLLEVDCDVDEELEEAALRSVYSPRNNVTESHGGEDDESFVAEWEWHDDGIELLVDDDSELLVDDGPMDEVSWGDHHQVCSRDFVPPDDFHRF